MPPGGAGQTSAGWGIRLPGQSLPSNGVTARHVRQNYRVAEPDKLFQRLRARHVWLDHLVRALNRYIDHNAYQYAASITYFTVLSVVPILMVGLSIGGFIIAHDAPVADELRTTITPALPGGRGPFPTYPSSHRSTQLPR